MLNLVICGSVNHVQEEDPWSNSSTPKKSKRSSKNPYSSLGLDKFSALLDYLNEKRHNILSQTGKQDGTTVRFQYLNSNDCVPIVIKLKDQRKKKGSGKENGEITPQKEEQGQEQDRVVVVVDKVPMEQPSLEAKQKEDVVKPSSSFPWMNIDWFKYRNPCYYLPIVFILILSLLTISGRSVVSLLTSIGWCMLPILIPSKPKITKRRGSLKVVSEIKTTNQKNKEFVKIANDLGVSKKKELMRKASDGKLVNNRNDHGSLKKKELLRRFSEIKGAKS